MTTTKELIARARLGFGTSAGMPTALLSYQKLCDALANALERMTAAQPECTHDCNQGRDCTCQKGGQ